MNKIKVEEFTKQILTYENVKYKTNGNNKFGVDCVGLIISTCRDLNIELNTNNEDLKTYKLTDRYLLLKELNNNCTILNKEEKNRGIKEGYILLLKFHLHPQHVVYCINENQIIHSTNINSVVKIENLNLFKDYIINIYKPNFLNFNEEIKE